MFVRAHRGALILLAALAPQAMPDSGVTRVVVLPLAAALDAPYAESYRVDLDRALREALGKDARIRVVERPPSLSINQVGLLEPATLGLSSTLQGPARDGRLALRVFDIGTGQTLAVSELQPSFAELPAALRELFDCALASWRARSSRGPGTGPQISSEAVMAYSRAVIAVDRGDTATAARLLLDALRLAPSYPAACVELQRLRPLSTCR